MTSSGLQISVEVDLARNVEELRERLIKAAARELLVQTSRWDKDDEHFTELANSLRNDISRAIRDEVEKAVAPAVETALAAGVQRTDQYGSPRGEKVPLRTVIVEEAQKALNKEVEYRDNYRRSENVVSQIIRNEVQKALAEDLKDVVRAEREKVQVAVRDEAARIITESVQRAARAVA